MLYITWIDLRIIDTKYMAAISPLKELINNSTLSDMSKTLDKDPFPKVKIGFKHFNGC